LSASNPTTAQLGIGVAAPQSRFDITTNSLGTTQTTTSGLLLANTTAAAAGAQQISPELRWRGYGWKTDATAASQSVDFRAHMVPVEGTANPTGRIQFESSINGGAFANYMVWTSQGRLGVQTATPSYAFHVSNTSDQVVSRIGNFQINNSANGGAGSGRGVAVTATELYLYSTNTGGSVGIKTNTANGAEGLRFSVESTGTVKVMNSEIQLAAWGLNGGMLKTVATGAAIVDTSTAASGTATNAVGTSFHPVNMVATNTAVTFTNAASVYIAGAPVSTAYSSWNAVTYTNKYSLWVNENSRFDGNVELGTAGNKIKIATGTNASMGTATLVAGTVTVSTTAALTGSTIFISRNTTGGTLGHLSAPAASITNATSFIINSCNQLKV